MQRFDAQQRVVGVQDGQVDHGFTSCEVVGGGSARRADVRPGRFGDVRSSFRGANRADVVRDSSARSMRMVSRVVRGRGRPRGASVTRSYQWATGTCRSSSSRSRRKALSPRNGRP